MHNRYNAVSWSDNLVEFLVQNYFVLDHDRGNLRSNRNLSNRYPFMVDKYYSFEEGEGFVEDYSIGIVSGG